MARKEPASDLCELLVRVVDGGAVFDFKATNLSFDVLGPFDFYPAEPPVEITVVRKGRIFDSGGVAERGTHGASLFFTGFEKCLPDLERFYGDAIGGYVSASMFQGEDTLLCTFPRETLRKCLIENWIGQLLNSEAYADDMARAAADEERLVKTYLYSARARAKKNRPASASHELKLAHKAYRAAYASVYRRVNEEPMPKVLTFSA